MRVSKRLLSALLFVWTTVLLALFYGVQKPISTPVFYGIIDTGWALLLAGIIVLNGAGIGTWLLLCIQPTGIAPPERLLLGTGLGLGILGITGFVITAAGFTQPALLLVVQLGMMALLVWRQVLHQIWADTRDLVHAVDQARTDAHPLLQGALAVGGLLAFLLVLVPPANFDALLYHLALPQWILRDGGLHTYNVFPFWFPGLVEGVYLWVLGIGSARASKTLHLIWTVLALLLVWRWAAKVWSRRIAWLSSAIVLSMPSVPILASWAYTDFALTLYAVVTLYSVWRWSTTQSSGWLVVTGLSAGLALSVKYTGFVVPLTAGLLILWWQRTAWTGAIRAASVFSSVALLIAAPWYLRNWWFMENPVYPFVWDGRHWDQFRAVWYAEAGTGIGRNLRELVLLPLAATLGYNDETFYDGRIGPLFLVFLPIVVWILWQARLAAADRRRAAMTIGLFATLSSTFWVVGVMNSRALWQTRLLFSALIPLTPILAVGLQSLDQLDTPALRVSYIVKIVVAAVIGLTLLETALFVIDRNPLAVATGLESREHYLHRVQPAYANAVDMLNQTPATARIYFLFEPRSYYMERQVQPDPILDNFAHGLYEHDDVETFVGSLRAQGYTHILLYRRGADFLLAERPGKMPPATVAALTTLTDDLLVPIATTEDGGYELYVLPDATE